MFTNLKYRARERQRKRESRRQASETQHAKGRQRSRESESIRVVALSSKLRVLPAPPYYSDHLRSFQNFNIIGNKMPKFKRAILVLRSFFCKE